MAQMEAPVGFRFHPTDEELVVHYLRRKACDRKSDDDIIGEVDLYKFEPWDLPEKCVLDTRDLEWYFFHAQDKKYPCSLRTNRATVAGYWKTTGKDRRVCSGGCMVGTKKTLVFYLGRAPNGERTDWIMHEYRLDKEFEKNRKVSCAFVLCRIHQKRGPGPRNGEQYGAPVLDENDSETSYTKFSSTYGHQPHPKLSENKVEQKYINDLNQPIPTGGLVTCSQVSNDVRETVPRVPNFMELPIDGIDDLHDILHPASNEAEILGEMLDTLLAGQDQAISTVENSVNQSEKMSPQSFAYNRDSMDDDYIELADLDHLLDEYLSTMPTVETDGLVIEQEPSIYEDNGIEVCTPSKWTQMQLPGLNEQGTAARRVRFQVPALQFNSENIGGIMYVEDSLQHPESMYRIDGKPQSPEVPMIISGEMEDISNIELQDGVNMYRSSSGESTFHDMSSGLGVTSDLWSSEPQTIKYDKKLNDTFLIAEPLAYAVSARDKVHVQPFEVENVSVVGVPEKRGYTVMSRETISAPLAGNVATGIVSSSVIKSGLEELNSISKTNLEDVSSRLHMTGVDLDSMGILLSNQNQCSHLDLADKALESLPQDISTSYFSVASVSVHEGQADTLCSTAIVKNDGIVITNTQQGNTLEITSAPGQDYLTIVNDVVEHSPLVDQSAYLIASTGLSSQPINLNSSSAVHAPEAAPALSSTVTLSPRQLPKSILRIIKLLGDFPALPASAAEFCLDQGQSKPAKKNPLDSEVSSSSNLKTVVADSEECFCFCKGEEEHLQAMLPVRSTPNKISSGLICRVKSDFSRDAKQLSRLPEAQYDYFSRATSNHKMLGLGKLLIGIFRIDDCTKLYKSLKAGFTILLFWVATLALIFFCLIRGFGRLRKGALAMIF